MKFKLTAASNPQDAVFAHVAHSLQGAAYAGWDYADRGEDMLKSLEVGQTCTDDDGDTWERVE